MQELEIKQNAEMIQEAADASKWKGTTADDRKRRRIGWLIDPAFLQGNGKKKRQKATNKAWRKSAIRTAKRIIGRRLTAEEVVEALA